MDYPADIYTDRGHSRIHEGHGLTPEVLRDDLDYAIGPRQPYDLEVEEVWMTYRRRVMWCDRIDGFGCDMNGEWHGHFSEVRAGTPGCAYTIVRSINEAPLVLH
jgi:hypothetical protein